MTLRKRLLLAPIVVVTSVPGCAVVERLASRGKGSPPNAATMSQSSSFSMTPSSAPSAAGLSSGTTAAAVPLPVDDGEADRAPKGDELVQPAPGIEKVAPMAPTWCDGADKKNMPRGVIDSAYIPENMKDYVLDSSNGSVSEQGAAMVAWSACMRPQDKNRQLWIASYRQEMLNTSGMTEAENREYMKLLMSHEDAREKAVAEACKKHDEAGATTPDERTRNAVFLKMLDCRAGKNDQGRDGELITQSIRHLAASPAINSQVALAAFVAECVGHRALNHGDDAWLMNPNTLANYAFCAHDVASLDRAKFHKELSSLALSPVERMAAIETFAHAKWLTDWQTATYRSKSGKQAWVKSVVFDAPREGFEAWTKMYKANAALIDLARSYTFKYESNAESQSKLKAAFAGCAAPLRKALAGYMKSKKPKSASEVREALTDGVGFPLVVAGAACEALQGKPGLAVGYRKLILMQSLGTNGPRHEAYKHAVRKVAEFAADQPKFPVAVNAFNPSSMSVEGAGWAEKVVADATGGVGMAAGWTSDDKPEHHGSTPDGVIKSVSPKAGGVLVQFKTESWNEPVFNCTPTNRIDRIDFSGGQAQVIYQQNCKYAGTEKRTFTLRPVWVPSEFAAGLRPGLTARIFASGEENEAPGFVVEAYADQQRRNLAYSMVTGL